MRLAHTRMSVRVTRTPDGYDFCPDSDVVLHALRAATARAGLPFREVMSAPDALSPDTQRKLKARKVDDGEIIMDQAEVFALWGVQPPAQQPAAQPAHRKGRPLVARLAAAPVAPSEPAAKAPVGGADIWIYSPPRADIARDLVAEHPTLAPLLGADVLAQPAAAEDQVEISSAEVAQVAPPVPELEPVGAPVTEEIPVQPAIASPSPELVARAFARAGRKGDRGRPQVGVVAPVVASGSDEPAALEAPAPKARAARKPRAGKRPPPRVAELLRGRAQTE